MREPSPVAAMPRMGTRSGRPTLLLALGVVWLALAPSGAAGQSGGIPGRTTFDSVSAPNSSGDLFSGGTWTNANGGSAWTQRDFDAPYLVERIAIAKAGTDVTTRGSGITIKLLTVDGRWVVVDHFADTNINWPGVGSSRSPYSREISPPVVAKAFRLELQGNGWFVASSIRLSGRPAAAKAIASPHGPAGGEAYWQYVGVESGESPFPPGSCYPDSRSGGESGVQVVRSKTCGEDREPFSRYSVEWGAPAPTLIPGRPMDFKGMVKLVENRRPSWTLPVLLTGKFLSPSEPYDTASLYASPPIGPQGNPHGNGEQFSFDNRQEAKPFLVPAHGLADGQDRIKFMIVVKSSSVFYWSYFFRWVDPKAAR